MINDTQKINSKNSFEKFTNLYELSKTLRFELKPTGNTQKMLEYNEVFKKDKIVDENYRKIKYYFDILHREFTKESLEGVILDFQEYYTEIKNDQKSKKIPKIEENLRKNLVKYFDKKADEWKEILSKQNIKLKENEIKILFEKDNLEILKFIFQKKDGKICFADILTGELKEIGDKNAPDIEIKTISGEKENLFESFKGFQGYLTNFHQSRKNFYSEKDQTTAISNRAINENLRRFCDNLKQAEEKKENYALLGLSEKENIIFSLEFYNKCLIQDGIDDYDYAVGAINAKINLYNQKNKDKKLRQFKSLYKQILSPKEQRIDTEIEKDEEVFPKMREFIALNEKKIAAAKKLFIDFAEHQEKYEINEIYIKGVALNTISSRWFSSWAAIGEKIMTGKADNKKFPDFVSFGELKKQFDAKNSEVKAEDLFRTEYKEIYKDSSSHYETFLLIWKKEFEENLNQYKGFSFEAQKMIAENKIYTNKKEKRTIKNKDGKIENIEVDVQKEKIKNYADSALGIFQMMKYFALEKGKKKVEDNLQDQNFYNIFNEYYYGEDDYSRRFIQIYNGLRNYLTKKQFKTDKIQLNFESASLLKGYDKDLESQRKAVILRENNDYYLAVLENNNNHIFEDENKIIPKNNEATIEKMYFKQQTNVFRQLPRFGFPYKNDKIKGLIINGFRNFDENKFLERQHKYALTNELLLIKDEFDIFQDSKEKGDIFDCNKLNKLIAYYKKIIEVDYKNIFEIDKILRTDYKELNSLYQDFESSAYDLKFKNISKNYVDTLVENKKLYLFKIYNKDFSKYKTGKDNLHTTYFKALFSIDTVNNKKLIQLGANARIFFRPKSIEKEIDKDRKSKREIIKNKRYTEDKYSFHCPIILNSGKEKNPNVAFKIINNKVLKTISETDKIRLIGIDRGEKHLLYLSVIDLDGNIHQVKSLNTISAPNKKEPVDYHKLLDEKEKGRDEARKSWQNIENIKELKEGYISQAVNEISKIIFDCLEKGEFPVIVFEDLNIGFKRGRFAIEKQVYQKFELALVKKLNYLVSKSKGNQREALQLTPPIGNFQDIYRQTGIIFYIPASFTSAICPVCGFRKRLIGFYFENKNQAKELLNDSLQDLSFDGEKFVFTMKIASGEDDNKKAKKENFNELFADIRLAPELKFNSAAERLINTQIPNTRKWETKTFNATENLKDIFREYKIEIKDGLKNSVLQGEFEANFYKRFIFAINTILKIRNSHTAENRDFIACPACGFHSEKDLKNLDKKYLGNEKFEFNGDANGAYNIARKGILVMKKIKQFVEKEDVEKIKFEHLTTNMGEWDKFVQQK